MSRAAEALAFVALAVGLHLGLFWRIESHWMHGFAVEKATERGVQRSLQVFDAAGDALHKVFLRDGSDLEAWRAIAADHARPDAPDTLTLDPRRPPEPAREAPDKAGILRREWTRMTDTHQFLRLVAKLKMNRLGAYRIAGAPFVRPLDPGAVDLALHRVRDAGIEVMIFVGNRGCIGIHAGPVGRLEAMGPWQNVLDPDFNLHLRRDRIAEVRAVEKPTRRGPALSVEAVDAEGQLILQVFGLGKEGRDSRPAWAALVAGLPEAGAVEAAE